MVYITTHPCAFRLSHTTTATVERAQSMHICVSERSPDRTPNLEKDSAAFIVRTSLDEQDLRAALPHTVSAHGCRAGEYSAPNCGKSWHGPLWGKGGMCDRGVGGETTHRCVPNISLEALKPGSAESQLTLQRSRRKTSTCERKNHIWCVRGRFDMRERASRQRTLHFIADPEKLRLEQVVQFEQEDRSEAPVFAHGDHDEGPGGWSRSIRRSLRGRPHADLCPSHPVAARTLGFSVVPSGHKT